MTFARGSLSMTFQVPSILKLSDAIHSQSFDFWYVEHIFHRNVLASKNLTRDPEEADYFLIPFYPACYFGAFAYDNKIDPARWTRLQRFRSEIHVWCGFRNVLRIMKRQAWWKRLKGKRHLIVFGQGRGANSGFIWQTFRRSIQNCIFLCVEARPYGNPDAFREGQDIVIPGYTPWQDVIDEVNRMDLPRDIFMHFRGRPWGDLRSEIFKQVRPSPNIILDQNVKFSLGGENRPALRDDAVAYFCELRRSIFCLCPSGWTPWSKRIYETILCGSIPVFIPGTFVPPFQHCIDYSKCSVTITREELPTLEAKLRSIPEKRIQVMLAEVARIKDHFVYHRDFPIPGDAFDLTLNTLPTRF